MTSNIKLKIIGKNHVFPWELGEIIEAEEIKHLENDLHQIIIGGEKYIMEFGRWGINNRLIFVEGVITDNTNVGLIAFEISYE